MPLSEEEQRILRQIEEQLQSDQRFANAVSSSGLYRHSARTLRWAIAGLIIGLGLLVLALQVHYLLAFAVFIGMLACVLVIERTARAMGKVGMADVAATMRRHRTNASSRLRRKG